MLILLAAAALRAHRLDHVPLRGDEAFTARFWAADPRQTWDDLAPIEPHPYGVFVLFWAWKGLAGESEFSLRALPLLVNLLGVAVIYAWGRRILPQAKHAWLLAVLWAVNPFQIWHAQDLRNYALWAALSPLAALFFWQALKTNQRRTWALYGFTLSLSCYVFLLEPFFWLVQGIYLALYARERWRPALLTWALVALSLTPLLIQGIHLAGSGYEGTATRLSLSALVSEFLPTLLFGEGRTSWLVGLGLGLVLAWGLWRGRGPAHERAWLALWLFLPLLLLTLFATQMSIFRPRYVIPLAAPLLLSLFYILGGARARGPFAYGAAAVLGGTAALSLYSYFYLDPPKAPDWRSLAAFISRRDSPGDLIILGNVDPAFEYYYQGPAEVRPWSDVGDPAALLQTYTGIFVQQGDSTAALSQYLQAEAQFIPPAVAVVKYYRPWEAEAAEIAQAMTLQLGDVARLRGYRLLGGDAWGLTLLLYWEPLRQTDLASEGEMVGFLHIPHPSGAGLLAQDDHPPLNGNAPTSLWLPGDLLRDAFYVQLGPGVYELVVGMYAAQDGRVLPILNEQGQEVVSPYPLARVEIE